VGTKARKAARNDVGRGGVAGLVSLEDFGDCLRHVKVAPTRHNLPD
jgi:hypothetical protein